MPSRNMYKGPKDRVKWEKDLGWEVGVVGPGKSCGGGWDGDNCSYTTIKEEVLKKIKDISVFIQESPESPLTISTKL